LKIYRLDEKPEHALKLKQFLNLSLERDFITDHMLRRCTVQDPNYTSKLTFLALEKDKLIGLLIGVERTRAPKELVEAQKHLAWIKVIAIPPKHRTKKLFQQLINEYLNEIKAKNKTEIRVANFPSWHFHPGIDIHYDYYLTNYLTAGFTKYGEVVDYEVDLKRFYIPTRIKTLKQKLIKQGTTFKEVTRGEINQLENWIKTKFSPYWAYEAKRATIEPTGGLLIAYNQNNQPIGFAAYGALEPSWLGPIGVIKKEQNKGIGTILLFKALKSMRLNGIRIATIPWTQHLYFYTQIPGITGIRHYWQLKNSIK